MPQQAVISEAKNGGSPERRLQVVAGYVSAFAAPA